MKIEFRFNGTQQILLIPENNKDKQLLQLFVGGHQNVKMVPPPSVMPEAVIFESGENPFKASDKPTAPAD